jgi:hypothetical protein
MKSILFLLVMGLPVISLCDGECSKQAIQLAAKLKQSVSCEGLTRAEKTLQLSVDSKGDWFFAGEAKTRDEILKKYGVSAPQNMIVYGYAESKSWGELYVIGFETDGDAHLWALKAVAQDTYEKLGFDHARNIIGGRDEFSSMGIYRKSKNDTHYDSKAIWISLSEWPQFWSKTEERPTIAKSCLSCQGWLCPEEPFLCLSDFNENGRPEYLFSMGGMDFSGTDIWEIDEKGKPILLHAGPDQPGQVERRGDKWILRPDVCCEAGGEVCGIGNSYCNRPMVLVYDRAKNEFIPSEEETDAIYPVTEMKPPTGCDKNHLLIWDGKRFFRLEK